MEWHPTSLGSTYTGSGSRFVAGPATCSKAAGIAQTSASSQPDNRSGSILGGLLQKSHREMAFPQFRSHTRGTHVDLVYAEPGVATGAVRVTGWPNVGPAIGR